MLPPPDCLPLAPAGALLGTLCTADAAALPALSEQLPTLLVPLGPAGVPLGMPAALSWCQCCTSSTNSDAPLHAPAGTPPGRAAMLSWSVALPTSWPPAPSHSSWAAQGLSLQRMAPPAALAGQGCSRQPSEPHQQVIAKCHSGSAIRAQASCLTIASRAPAYQKPAFCAGPPSQELACTCLKLSVWLLSHPHTSGVLCVANDRSALLQARIKAAQRLDPGRRQPQKSLPNPSQAATGHKW